MLAADTDLWTDTTWVVDSTPVECGRFHEAAKRRISRASGSEYSSSGADSHRTTRADLIIGW
jgi:hypothetical protein